MIASTSSIEGTTVTGDLRSKKLSITNEGISHIANILQDTLYTDKVLAPIREYSTNAMDAHVEVGSPLRPILVKLPNRFSPMFAVRDYGFGMDDDRIWNVFCNYGSSTKRGTNTQVGMLGIGSKSAFAYPNCKSFTVISIQNGVKKSFVCHKGGCSEGELILLAEEATTEENGLEIQIPVSAADIQSFIDRSARFFAHWEVTPMFEGATINIAKSAKLFEGVDWYMAADDPNGYGTKGTKLLMGNISYAVGSISTMKCSENGISDDDQYVYRKLLDANLVLKAPIGSVDIAANREALQMTDKTIKALWEILKKVRNEIGLELQKKFDVLPTMWDKRVLRSAFNSYNTPLATFSSFLPQHLSNLATAYRISDDCGFEVVSFSKGRRGKCQVRGSNYPPYSIEAKDDNCVIINDDPSLIGNKVRGRVAALIERTDNYFKKSFRNVYVFNIKNVTKFNLWKAEQVFDYPVVNLNALPHFKFSEIYPHLRKPSTRSINADKNSKKFLILDMSCTGGGNSDYFKAGTVPKRPVNKIPYIVIDRYYVATKGGELSPDRVISHLNALVKEFNVKLPDTIVAVKAGSVLRLEENKNYISLWEFLSLQLKTNKEFFNRLVTLELRSEFGCLVEGNGNRHISAGDVSVDSRTFSTFDGKMDDFDETKLFHKILVSYTVMKSAVVLEKTAGVREINSVISSIRESLKTLDDKVASTVAKSSSEFKSLVSGFFKTYPMVKLVDSYNYGYSVKPACVLEIGNYIKLVDSSTK